MTVGTKYEYKSKLQICFYAPLYRVLVKSAYTFQFREARKWREI